jgi:hypothetical protein
MKKAIFAAACLLLLTAQVPKPAETAPAEPPSDVIKRRALLMGYWLNKDSMVRALSLGSIDVFQMFLIPDQPPTSTIPPR